MVRWVPAFYGRTEVLTLVAVILLIAGLLTMKVLPVLGFLMLVAGIALGGKAVNTPDDVEWFGGACLMLGGVYTIYLFALKLL